MLKSVILSISTVLITSNIALSAPLECDIKDNTPENSIAIFKANYNSPKLVLIGETSTSLEYEDKKLYETNTVFFNFPKNLKIRIAGNKISAELYASRSTTAVRYGKTFEKLEKQFTEICSLIQNQ